MNTSEHTEHGNVELVRNRISKLFTQCLNDIEKAVSTSGLTMRDVGIEVENYSSSGELHIVEMKLQQIKDRNIHF